MGRAQLTLPPGSQHFYPAGACSRCAEIVEFPEPVLTTADLELSGQPHLCQACARTGIDPTVPARSGDGPGPSSEVKPAEPSPTPASTEPSPTPASTEPIDDAAPPTEPIDDAAPPTEPIDDAAPPTEPDQLDAAPDPRPTAADSPSPPSSARIERQYVPAVRTTDGNDIEQVLRAEVGASWGAGQTRRSAEGNGSGDGFDRVGEYVAIVLRSATLRAEEIRDDAELCAARLLENAEQRASEQLAAATLALEEADRDRDEVAALAAKLEETFAGEQEQLNRRLAEAESDAEAVREAAEADAARIREAAEADAARMRESAAAVEKAADAELEAAIALSDEASSPSAARP